MSYALVIRTWLVWQTNDLMLPLEDFVPDDMQRLYIASLYQFPPVLRVEAAVHLFFVSSVTKEVPCVSLDELKAPICASRKKKPGCVADLKSMTEDPVTHRLRTLFRGTILIDTVSDT